jgi:DNA-binding GntR family transcriptional regulator
LLLKGYRTKRETIYETLKQEIYEGKYKFGEKLIISRLAKRFESSEIPVREAINQLSSEGLVDIEPHVGAVVSPLSSKDIQNIFDMRIVLEALATRLATEHLTPEDFQGIRTIMDQSIEAFQQKDYGLITNLNFQFHMHIYSKCDNELLVKTIRDLWMNTNRYPSLFERNDEHIRLSLEEHEAIYKALLDRDGVLAETITLKHKARAYREILRLAQRNYYNV